MRKLILSAAIACFGLAGTANAKKLCEGIFPKNNKWIGVNFVDQGISESVFNAALDKVVSIYNPIAAAHGMSLNFNRLWSDGTVNSDTDTEGTTWVINAYGGLARYDGMTSDGYTAVACHELGHHLGGAPLFQDGSDMSVEGEADYHVGTKCLRKIFAGDDNVSLMKGATIDPLVVTKCSASFMGDAGAIALCERSAAASYVVAKILMELDQDPAIGFSTPDTSVVTQTNEDHPAAQCRLDTYFQSGICTVSSDVEFSNSDYKVGACVNGDGSRPLCWFSPGN